MGVGEAEFSEDGDGTGEVELGSGCGGAFGMSE